MKIKHSRYLNRLPRLDGKTVVITGASGAIGKQITANILMLGADVILPTLTVEEGQKLKGELSERFDAEKIALFPLNLLDADSIKNFAKQMEGKSINYLINNAGVMGANDYAVNFKGTVELTLALTPILNKTENSCAAFQSSFSYRLAKIDWKNPAVFSGKRINSYACAKRLLNLAIVALRQDYLREFQNVRYEIAHPGCVFSDITGSFGGRLKKVVNFLTKAVFHSAQTAALSIVVTTLKPVPDKKLVGPRWFGIWGKPKFRKLDKRLYGKEQEKIKRSLKSEFDTIR